ncbi:MAG: PEGA domain-containing protein [Pirellulales bacterium]|nr:PEGA domain-containing protein [Pirellulales bacterium]
MIIALSLTGCVRRRMTIRSNPPGALVYVDDYEIGTTPVSTNFTYYGTRKIRLVKEGYETLTVMQPIGAPWYQIPPLDFLSENFLPGELRDRRTLCYQLRPQMVVPDSQLRGRAEELRARGRIPLAMAPPGMSPTAPRDAFPPESISPGLTSPESVPAPQGQPYSGTQPMQPFPLNAQPIVPAQPQGAPGLGASPSSVPPGAWTPPPGPAGP